MNFYTFQMHIPTYLLVDSNMTFALLVGNFSISKSKTNIMSELLSSHETNYV